MKLFKKKQKTNLQYTNTEKAECNISIIHMDNFKEICKLPNFDGGKGTGLSHMVIKMDIDTTKVTNLNEYMKLFELLRIHDHYIDENGSLLIIDTISRWDLMNRLELERVCKDDDNSILLHQLKDFLDKVFDKDNKYDEVFRPTNHISLSALKESTENCCEIINEFTYGYPNKKTCVILKMDNEVISWIKNIIYTQYDHNFYWIEKITVDENRTYIVIDDIEFVANELETHFLYQIDDDIFELEFKKLSPVKQKVYEYFMNFLRKYKTGYGNKEESDNVDFSDIDEVID